MSLLDTVLGQVGGMVNLDDIAAKVGLSTDELKQGGETLFSKISSGENPMAAITQTAEETGIDAGKLQEMLPAMAEKMGVEGGGEGLLSQLTGEGGILGKVGGFLDQDGDGNPLNDVTGMVGKLFGKS